MRISLATVRLYAFAALFLWLPVFSFAQAPPGPPAHIADLLEGKSADLGNPVERARLVEQMREIETRRKADAVARAAGLGMPVRVERPDGSVIELMAFEGDRPIYAMTLNSNAAISSGANLLHAPPYDLDGSNFTIGIWDGGAVRASHQEFGGRVTVKDGATNIILHATHVGGTLAAAGVNADAKGMSPGVHLDSYEWNSDKTEMTGRGASYPGEPGKIYISNHSYNYIAGWYNLAGNPKWEWWGLRNNDGSVNAGHVEDDFGKYSSHARDSDSLAFSMPYYLMFRAAGNDRSDNPANGETFRVVGFSTTHTYDSASHPAGDAKYKGNGYDTISFDPVAKNVITVGSVNDAVTGGIRDASKATMSTFSSWGPTDDGRIKPDVVANGAALVSTGSGSNTAYTTLSGTSMAAPNAAGSAHLLVSLFDQLFPGHVMRASTLKGLLIHTADDRGNAGPDYQYGWGLINVKAAADLLEQYSASPGNRRMIENRLTTAKPADTYTFVWNGSTPIRVTLCWTDPAGAATTSHDLRTARLVNNLDVAVTGPTGILHQPYVMPYVGNWTSGMLSAAATTGKNNTDNVEQVYIAAPPATGTYSVTITHDGALANNQQNYSLLITGGVDAAPAPAPSALSSSPATGTTGTVTLTITGSGFLLGADVRLTRTGQADVIATGVEVVADSIKARINANEMASGGWNVVVTNPDGQQTVLANAFTISGALWQENFEPPQTGWTSVALVGGTHWAVTTASSRSPTRSYHAPGPATRNDDTLVSPAISIPADAQNLRLGFWHRFNFQNGRDGGVLEFSLNGGAWFDASGSGASFATGGYNATLNDTGPRSSRNPLGKRSAWSGATSGFVQVLVNLDASTFAGKSLRVRWRLGTDGSTASEGWYIDDIEISGATAANLAPTVISAATASSEIVTGTSVDLSVAAEDDAGESALTYTWTATGNALVDFSENGTNAAKNTTAVFEKAGAYGFTVTVRDAENLSATSSVDVSVEQTHLSTEVAPLSAEVGVGLAQPFSATAKDQFGDALDTPPVFTWNVSGGGAINEAGLFTAANTPGGPHLVTASGAVNGAGSVTVRALSVAEWKSITLAGHPESADIDDPDLDGIPNLLEYALDGDPLAADAAKLPVVSLAEIGEEQYLQLSFTRPAGITEVSYAVEAGDLTAPWNILPILPEDVISDGVTETVAVTDTEPLSSVKTRRFLRLRVTR